MYITVDKIVEFAAVLAAVIAICTAAYKVVKWLQTQEKQSSDIDELKKKEAADIQEIMDEQCMISYALLACLDGLKQLNCNGPVTEAHNRLQKHLNKRAHVSKRSE